MEVAMKIHEISPDFAIDDDITPTLAVKIFKAVIMSGKESPNLSDYAACPNCGHTHLKLLEHRKSMSWVKGTALICDNCSWNKVADEWEYLPANEQELLAEKYGLPQLVEI